MSCRKFVASHVMYPTSLTLVQHATRLQQKPLNESSDVLRLLLEQPFVAPQTFHDLERMSTATAHTIKLFCGQGGVWGEWEACTARRRNSKASPQGVGRHGSVAQPAKQRGAVGLGSQCSQPRRYVDSSPPLAKPCVGPPTRRAREPDMRVGRKHLSRHLPHLFGNTGSSVL